MSPVSRRQFVKAGVTSAAGFALGSTDVLASRSTAPGQLRIAVIGAGVAGLTAAHTLKQLGYANVSVFERSATPGGKVLTDHSLGTPIELGAVFATTRYETTLQLAREVGVSPEPLTRNAVVLDDDGTVVPLQQFGAKKHGVAAFQRAVQRYAELAAQYRVHARRGFAGSPPALFVPFAEFAEKNEVVPFVDMVSTRLAGYGYAYCENVPALYYLKGLPALGAETLSFPRGYQDLWLRVAERLNVRCSADVRAVRRRSTATGPRIEMDVNGEEQVFDRLIVATPCEATARYLDLTSEERELLAQVVKGNYHVTVARVTGLSPERATLYSYPGSRASAPGRVACWYDPAPPQPIYTAYQNVGASQSDRQARQFLEEDFKTAGGGIVNQVLLERKWTDYFEHVESAALSGGFYDRFEALQGRNGTLYITGLLALEGVETVARYARDLVSEMFAPQSTRATAS